MKWKFCTVALVLLILSGCVSSPNAHDIQAPATTATVTTAATTKATTKATTTTAQQWTYFETDPVVEDFFVSYNELADVPISADKIERGNIKTKALVYIEDLSVEVINAKTFLAVSASTAPENEETTLYAIFRGVIKTVDRSLTDDAIKSAWDEIRGGGYLTEKYDLNGVKIGYLASASLSWGTTKPRIDIEIPIE